MITSGHPYTMQWKEVRRKERSEQFKATLTTKNEIRELCRIKCLSLEALPLPPAVDRRFFWMSLLKETPLRAIVPIILDYVLNPTNAMPSHPITLQHLTIDTSDIIWHNKNYIYKGWIECKNEIEMPYPQDNLYCQIHWIEKREKVMDSMGYVAGWSVVSLTEYEPKYCTLIPINTSDWVVDLYDDMARHTVSFRKPSSALLWNMFPLI